MQNFFIVSALICLFEVFTSSVACSVKNVKKGSGVDDAVVGFKHLFVRNPSVKDYLFHPFNQAPSMNVFKSFKGMLDDGLEVVAWFGPMNRSVSNDKYNVFVGFTSVLYLKSVKRNFDPEGMHLVLLRGNF